MHCVYLTRDTVADESRVKFLLCVEETQAMPKACLAEENAKWPVREKKQRCYVYSMPEHNLTEMCANARYL